MDFYALLIFDLIGTFAFAVTGVIGGLKRKLDIIGALFCGATAALGGGIIRDAILGVPATTFSDERYLLIVALATLGAYIFSRHVVKNYTIFLTADALGLAVFTLIGVNKALEHEYGVLAVLVLGCITAVGGGVIRDILVQRVPCVLQQELYVIPSLVGGFLFLLLHPYIDLSLNLIVSGLLIFVFRMVSIRYKLSLPTKSDFQFKDIYKI